MLHKQIQEKGVMVLTLKRDGKLNALSDDFLCLIADAIVESQKDNELRAIVISGSTTCFAAGADLQELRAKDTAATADDARVDYWQKIAHVDKPLIAAVNGYAFGAGCELAMLCDVIIAGTNAQFALPECRLGIMPGAGGTQRLLQSVGKSLAMQMALSGEPIDAQQALRAGLVSEITAPQSTLTRAVNLAKKIADNAPLAVKMIKKSINIGVQCGLSSGLAFERQCFIQLASSADKQEGIAAFLEKRKAQFHGN